MRRILLDADTLIKLIINRSMFQEKVKDLCEIINIEGVEFYLSDRGLKKIRDIAKTMNGYNASKKISYRLRNLFKIKILKTTKFIIEEARILPIKNFDSCIEIALAINSSITAIITHEVSKFSDSELNVWSLTDFQNRENLEKIFSKETNDRPIVLDIKNKIITLNHLYTLPSYASEEPLKAVKIHRKLVISHDITSPIPSQDPSRLLYRDLIDTSSILAMHEELFNHISASFASLRSVQESTRFIGIFSPGKSKILNPTSTSFASLKSTTDIFTAPHSLQELSRSKLRDLIAKSSIPTMDKELLNPTSASFASLKSKLITLVKKY